MDVCVLSRGKGASEEEEGGGGERMLWNYSYSLNAERNALDSHAQEMQAQTTHPRIRSDLL